MPNIDINDEAAIDKNASFELRLYFSEMDYTGTGQRDLRLPSVRPAGLRTRNQPRSRRQEA
jgi:hypothetical protein